MKHGLFRELKRRHVYRVAVAYAVVGWLLIEVATQVFPFFHVPNWSIRLLVLLVVAGFPVAIILAWAFEVTPDGVRRTESAESAEARAPEQHRRVGRKLDYTIISVLALALVLALWRPWSSHPAPAAGASTASPADAAPGKSIAVLPFENLSNDKTNAYFADGMQDLILTKLADIGELKVISRTSTMQYGSHPRNLKQIGKDLGVATILEGSVQKAGDQVLINVQLINAQTDAHIWAESYQRTLKNIFGVEGEVAGKIAKSLAASLSPSETKRLAHTLSTNPAANDLYLQADYFAHAGILNVDTAAFGKAIPLYRKAIEMAPDFARARAQLSITESMLAWFGGGGEDVKQLNADAQAQARQALSLAPEMTAARLAAGYVNYYGHGAYAAALKDFDAALELRPNDAKVLRARSYVQRRLGHYVAAIASQQKAFELDPRNSTAAFDLGLTYMALYRYAEAKKYLQRALALDPNNYQARSYYAFAIYYSGGEASRALKEVQGLNPGEGGYFSRLVRWNILIYQRRYREALAAVEAVPDKAQDFSGLLSSKALHEAWLYHLLGKPEKARALYAKALPEERAKLASFSGGAPINRAFPLIYIARAEIGSGQVPAGLAETKRILALVRDSGDGAYGPYLKMLVARCLVQAGRTDQALTLLDQAFSGQYLIPLYAPRLLWEDPAWDPIRTSPRFQALLKKLSRFKPANSTGAGAG